MHCLQTLSISVSRARPSWFIMRVDITQVLAIYTGNSSSPIDCILVYCLVCVRCNQARS